MEAWDRQRGDDGELEPLLWFVRFTLHLRQGSTRSLLGTVNLHRDTRGQERSNNVPGSWRRAFEKWNWSERMEAWDIAELERIKDEFQERSDAWRSGRFDDAEALREKALQLLKLPVITRKAVDEDGAPYIVLAVPPTTLRAAAGILETADKLARITTRETLPTTELSAPGGKDLLPVDKVIAAMLAADRSKNESK